MFKIVEMIFGSHLYGTNTPNSDKDYMGIFLPSQREILLGRIPKTISSNTKTNNNAKNTPDDVDISMFSLHYFIEKACSGETITLDMLHAPPNMLIYRTYIWDQIVKHKHRFYTRSLSALIGYARHQAAKYGVRGSRLNDAKQVVEFAFSRPGKVKQYWDELPEGEHIFKHPENVNGVRMYEVCGRKIGETCSMEELYTIVAKFYDNYGERARKAAANVGIDWKAVSHALRAAYQIKEILTEGTITFPLKEANFLKRVKCGELHFTLTVQPILDNLMI